LNVPDLRPQRSWSNAAMFRSFSRKSLVRRGRKETPVEAEARA